MSAPSQGSVTNTQEHGGEGLLTSEMLDARKLAEARGRAARLPALEIDARAASDLFLLGAGAFQPLRGFSNFRESLSIVEEMSLPDGSVWPFPILLQTSEQEAGSIRASNEIALRHKGALLGTLQVEDWFAIPLQPWAEKIYRTGETAHPGVANFLQRGKVALAGSVAWLGEPATLGLDENWHSPEETRAEFARRGWRKIVAFQTRNPIHRAHEYVLRTALEVSDGLMLHPLVGETRPEDLPAPLRMRCYKALLENYLPKESVFFSVLPAWMRYGGPREALFHALVRRNFGCTHFCVGRDHAGVGGYYGPYDAHRLLESLGPKLGIQPIFFDEVFYCRRCHSMASRKTCGHPADEHLKLSGSEVRRRLREGLPLPAEFTRPEVAAILAEAFRGAPAVNG